MSFEEKQENLKKSVNYVYTYITGKIPNVIKPIIKHNQDICAQYGIPFKIFDFVVDPGQCAAGKSDWLRIEAGSKIPRTLYVDWDCEIVDFPDFNPLIPMVSSNYPKEIDLWAFYNGDRTDLFDLLYRSLVGKFGEFGSYWKYLNTEDFKKEFKIITEFKHKNISTGRITRPVAS